jgi:thymidylate synthase ThyX
MTSIITESMRYIDNAKDILREKAQKEDGLYQDKKYVKMAGHTAYVGVLVALDELLGVKKKGRKSIEWYKSELSKMDKKISSTFSNVYDTLHLALSYDGNQDAELAQNGLKRAEQIINWVDTRLQRN